MESNKLLSGEKYNLRWNSHKNSLVHHLGDHLAQEELVDVTLACSGKYIKAHKLILSSCSLYFRELFQIHKVENPMIIMNNVKFEELKCIIDFIYNGEIQVQDSELQGVLLLGNNLKIKGLSSITEKNLANKSDNQNKPESESNKRNEVNGSVFKDVLIDEKSCQNEPSTDESSNKLVDNAKNVSIKRKSVNSSSISSKVVPVASSEMVQNLEAPKIGKSSINKKHYNEIEVDTSKTKKRKITVIKAAKEPKLMEMTVAKEILTHTAVPLAEVGDSNVLKIEAKEYESQVIDSSKDVKPTEHGVVTQVKPVSAFMIFANEWRKRLAVEHPNESNKQISVRLSNMWKNLSEETKDTFYEMASRAYADQKQKFKGAKR